LKECFLITTHCDTENKVKALLECINTLKQYNVDISIIAHYPLSSDIQKSVNYYIFSSDNPILSRYNRVFHTVHNYHLEIRIYDYAYTVIKSWKEGINFLRELYSVIHVINYDTNIIPELYNITKLNIEKYNKSIFYTNYCNLDLVHVINFTLLYKDYDYFIEQLDLNKFLSYTFPGFSSDTLLPTIEQYISSILNSDFHIVKLMDWNIYINDFIKNEMNLLGLKNKQLLLDNGLYSQLDSTFLFTDKQDYKMFIGNYNDSGDLYIMLFDINKVININIDNLGFVVMPSKYILTNLKKYGIINISDMKKIKINNKILDDDFIKISSKLECKILNDKYYNR
jgi:hypothetical protein